MKYKVGDKVRVRKDIFLGRSYGNWAFIHDMAPLIGQHVTITKVLEDSYKIEEDTCRITDEMLEDVEEEFKLPEKWHVKLTKENKLSLEGWRTHGGITSTEGFVVSETHGLKGYFYPVGKLPSEFKAEITFDQFKKYVLKEIESTPVKEEVKFEVGRWYKYSDEYINHKTYAKYSSNQSVGGRFYYDEIITENNGFKKGHNWSILTCNPVLLTDLSEIQRYLPENHPDKIKRKTKKVEDLRYPDVVHCSSKEQRDKINSFAILEAYEGDKWYLTGAYGVDDKPYTEDSNTRYVNYEFSDIIFPEEKIETKPMLSKEELLAEAKRRYPVGTRFMSVNNKRLYTVETNSHKWRNDGIDVEGIPWVYLGGKWAEIVESPTVQQKFTPNDLAPIEYWCPMDITDHRYTIWIDPINEESSKNKGESKSSTNESDFPIISTKRIINFSQLT